MRRFFALQPQQKLFQDETRPFDFQEDALGGIVDPAGEAQSGGEAEDKRSEPYTLHRAANGDLQSHGWRHIHRN